MSDSNITFLNVRVEINFHNHFRRNILQPVWFGLSLDLGLGLGLGLDQGLILVFGLGLGRQLDIRL